MSQITHAYAWRNGVIEFGRETPEDALTFAIHEGGRIGAFIDMVSTKARHGYSDSVLLVPGVPEAASGDDAVDAVDALVAWADWAFGPPEEAEVVSLTDADLDRELVP